jgi:quinol monooxygenase YgiN
VYVSHNVEGQPEQRIFYELYEDREAFDEHERQEHVRDFLAQREALVSRVQVDFMSAITGKAPNLGDIS